jgi:hypothetical protein
VKRDLFVGDFGDGFGGSFFEHFGPEGLGGGRRRCLLFKLLVYLLVVGGFKILFAFHLGE